MNKRLSLVLISCVCLSFNPHKSENCIIIWDKNGNFISKTEPSPNDHEITKLPNGEYLIYEGNSILKPQEYNLPYNPIEIGSDANILWSNPEKTDYERYLDTTCVSNEHLDPLPNGIWERVKVENGYFKLLEEKSVLNERLDGSVKYYFSDGKVKYSASFKMGYAVDSSYTCYPDGVIATIVKFRDCGFKQSSRSYFRSGEIKGLYENEVGLQFDFYSSGKLKRLIEKDKDLPHGKSITFSEDGEIENIKFYEYGKEARARSAE